MTPASMRGHRVLAYSHDSYGLGHLRRSVSIAAELVDRWPSTNVLCLSGSPAPDLFGLPPRCDIVKLPCLTKNERGEYAALDLPLPVEQLVAMRGELILATLRAYRPDVFLVDHTPIGPLGELLPALAAARAELPATRLVLGLRDIVDAPLRARTEFADRRRMSALRDVFGVILVYGERAVFDVCREYGWPAEVERKVEYVGYVCPPRHTSRAAPPGEAPRIVVSAGGGADGFDLLHGVVDAVRGPLGAAELDVTVVTGPLMGADRAEALHDACRDDPRLTVVPATSDMGALIDTADLAIGMAGYNSIFEALSRGKRLLALPRTAPRLEQVERCRRLARLGALTELAADDLAAPDRMARAIERALAREPGPAPRRFDYGGAARAGARIAALLGIAGSDHDDEADRCASATC